MEVFNLNKATENYLSYRAPLLFFPDVRGTVRDDWIQKQDSFWEALLAFSGATEERAKEMIKKLGRAKERAKERAKGMKAVFEQAFYGENDGSISSSQMPLVLEKVHGIVSWERLFGIFAAGPESDHDAGIHNMTGKAKIIGAGSVRCTLHDLAVQLLLSKTYAILFPDLINADLPICKRWKDVLSETFQTLRNALKKVRSKKSGVPNIVNNGLSHFKSASKLAVGMVIIGSTPAVGAMAPEVVEPGSLQTEDFEKSSNFAFGVVACVGTLVAIIALLKSFNWSRSPSIEGTSAASAPTGAILNGAVNMPQTLTVLRSWRETEFREVVVARHEEEGAYAS